MEKDFIEQLLCETESAYLDFKRDQYKFNNSTDIEKSELLKDILAFTNAWRRTDAYILIGVEENYGEKNRVVGVDHHIDEHSLQQFVNSKTQRPINFSYIPTEYQGIKIGIIHIPLQERPVFLLKRYGKLKRDTVYIRRGSSTDQANPDEIARMGLGQINSIGNIKAELFFGDKKTHEVLGKLVEIKSQKLTIQNRDKIPDFIGKREASLLPAITPVNKNFFRDLVKYYDDKYLLHPVSFVLENTGNCSLQNSRVVITNEYKESIKIVDWPSLTDTPISYPNPFLKEYELDQKHLPEYKVSLTHHEKKWVLELGFGNIQPKAKTWLIDKVFFGSTESCKYEIKAVIYADNLPEPLQKTIEISFITEEKQSDLRELNEQYTQMQREAKKEYDNNF